MVIAGSVVVTVCSDSRLILVVQNSVVKNKKVPYIKQRKEKMAKRYALKYA